MQDQQPTSHSDAEAEAAKPLDTAAPLSANGSLAVPVFDVDAFEEAAARFRPSWDDIDSERLSSDVIAAEFEDRAVASKPVPSEQPFVVRGTGETDTAPAEVVVPRPPRTPQLDYTGMRTNDGDDVGMAIPTRSLKGVWIAVAVFAGAAILAFIFTRGVDKPQTVIAEEAPPVAAQATPPEPAKPVVEAPQPAPIPEPAAAAPQPVEASPAEVVPDVAPSPVPEPAPVAVVPKETHTARNNTASTRVRPERTRASKPKRAASENRSISTPNSASSPKKPKRGAGFVSTNPY